MIKLDIGYIIKISEKKGFRQWFINKWNKSRDLEVNFTDEEEEIAFSVGKYIVPNETDRGKILQAVMEYWFVLLIVKNYEEA